MPEYSDYAPHLAEIKKYSSDLTESGRYTLLLPYLVDLLFILFILFIHALIKEGQKCWKLDIPIFKISH